MLSLNIMIMQSRKLQVIQQWELPKVTSSLSKLWYRYIPTEVVIHIGLYDSGNLTGQIVIIVVNINKYNMLHNCNVPIPCCVIVIVFVLSEMITLLADAF